MNKDAKTFAKNLRILMEHHGDTQKALEKRSGVSQKTISNMLNPGDERSPNLDNIALIAKCYRLETWQILIPNAPIEVLTHQNLVNLITNYLTVDNESRITLEKVAENAARYQK